MQPFEIFRPGKHTSAAGTAIQFSEADLQASVAAYNPALHEAPITIGHPKDNLPAYGWVQAVAYSDQDGMTVKAHQTEEQFEEMVQAGRFKKRSASFYTPDSPANPVPGVYYLRHVAFLGAQPPAIKGLKDVAFNENEEGVIEFFEGYETAGLFRRLREWMIGRFGTDDADKVIPSYVVEDLEAAGRRELEAPTPEVTSNAFTETETGAMKMDPNNQNPAGTPTQNAPAGAAAPTPTEDRAAEFAERETTLKAREEALAAREREIARGALVAQFNEHAAAGRLRPADVPALVDFAAGLDDQESVEFGEGDTKASATPRAFLMDFLGKLPKAIDYGEHGAGGANPEPMDNETVASKARVYQAKVKADTGRAISFTEAVTAVHAGKE